MLHANTIGNMVGERLIRESVPCKCGRRMHKASKMCEICWTTKLNEEQARIADQIAQEEKMSNHHRWTEEQEAGMELWELRYLHWDKRVQTPEEINEVGRT